jgi:hypothetical protein
VDGGCTKGQKMIAVQESPYVPTPLVLTLMNRPIKKLNTKLFSSILIFFIEPLASDAMPSTEISTAFYSTQTIMEFLILDLPKFSVQFHWYSLIIRKLNSLH